MLAADRAANEAAETRTLSLADVEPFIDLPEAVMKAVAEISEEREYADGETIFAMGQFDGSEVIVVLSGHVRISYADVQTGAMLFEEFAPGDIFGLARSVIGGEDERFGQLSLMSGGATKLVSIDAEALRVIVAQRRSLTKNLMYFFARHVAGGSSKFNARESSPERRIFATLVEFVERDAVSGQWRIVKMPKHRELADRANVDEVDAAAAIATLIQSGVAVRDYPGLIITDMSQLNRLAN